jgi:hypothetical protein
VPQSRRVSNIAKPPDSTRQTLNEPTHTEFWHRRLSLADAREDEYPQPRTAIDRSKLVEQLSNLSIRESAQLAKMLDGLRTKR